MQNNRNINIDIFRALAACAVVLFHLNESVPYKPGNYSWLCKQGWLGVPVFFVVSGWCLSSIARRETNVGAFCIARAARILPPYWISLSVVGAVIGWRLIATGVNDVTPIPRTPGSIAATLTLLTSPVSKVLTMNWVYWTLSYEVAFYFVVAIGIMSRRPITTLLVAVATDFVPKFEILGLNPMLFTDQIPLFALGFTAERARSSWKEWIVIAALVMISFIQLPFKPVIVAVVTTLALRFGSNPQRVASWQKALAAVGVSSYGLYLLHVPLGCHVILRLRPAIFLQNNLLHILFDLAALGICIGIAMLFYRFVEYPSMAWGKTLADKIRPFKSSMPSSLEPDSTLTAK